MGKLDRKTPNLRFGPSRHLLLGAGALLIVGIFFSATLWALNRFFPTDSGPPATLAIANPPPPLQPITRASHVIAPVSIALTAIGQTLEATAPRDFAGKNDNPVTKLLGQAQIGLTVARGTMSASGQQPDTLIITTPLNGSIQITGQIGNVADKTVGVIGGTLGGLVGSTLNKQVGNFGLKALDQKTDFHGNVVVTSHPKLTPLWRIEPNLAGRLDFGGGGTTNIAGIKLNLASEIKPMLDPVINSQISALESHLRSERRIERTAREQWSRLCRAIPLGGGETGLPPLWLEMRPIRAAAAQPQVDTRNVTLTIGVQAETRIVPNETKPNCPLPAPAGTGPAEAGRGARGGRADRHAVHRAQQVARAAAEGPAFSRRRQRARRCRGAARQYHRLGRSAAVFAAGEGTREEELVRLRRGSDGAHLGQAAARSGIPDPAPDRRFARGRIGSGFRPARPGGTRSHALF